MLTEFLSLLCLALCLAYDDEKKDEKLPAPILLAWPSSMVHRKSNVTLKCWSPFQNSTVRLGKLNSTWLEQQPSLARQGAELLLVDLQPEDAGRYVCTYKTTGSKGWSESSHLRLVVTGSLPRPSLSRGREIPGVWVVLQCLIPYNGTECMAVALLKSGQQEPLQVHDVRENPTDFMLWTMLGNTSGNYSCVYYQRNFPYLGSFPSNRVKIWATTYEGDNKGHGFPSINLGGYDKPNISSSKEGSSLVIYLTVSITLSFSILFLSVFIVYRCTPSAAAQKEGTRRTSHSECPGPGATDFLKPERTYPSSEDSGSHLGQVEHEVTV